MNIPIRRRRQAGGGAIMIWGMVFPNGLICIKEITGTLNAQKYIALLDEFDVPYMKKNLNLGFPSFRIIVPVTQQS